MASEDSVEELEALFKRYCLLGQGHNRKKTTLNQTQMNKLFMDSGVYKEFPKLDRNVLGIYWSYAFKKEKEITYPMAVDGWKNVFADRYNIDSKGEVSKDDFWNRFSSKLEACEGPKLAATKVDVSANVMGRLTDSSKYTGMHKQRTPQSANGKAVGSKSPRSTASAPGATSTNGQRATPASTASSKTAVTKGKPATTRNVAAASNGTR